MYATGAFKNPFADFDFSKIAGEFKMPTMNIESIVETGRKNFERLVSEAATTALDFLDQGCEVALLTREESLPFGSGLRHRLRLLEILALVEPRAAEKAPLFGGEASAGASRLHLGLAPPANEKAAERRAGAA